MKTPLILGRPFPSTTNAHIDVGAGEIKFNINGKEERSHSSQDWSNAQFWSVMKNKK
jgi:hypothetical protein